MAFCPNCGTQATGRFCPNCGNDMGAAAEGASASAGSTAAGGYVPPAGATPLQAPGLTENVASALCYLLMLITGIVFLVLSPYNRNRTVRFHAFQAIFASIAVFVIDIVLGIFTAIMYAAHVGFLSHFIWLAWELVVFAGWLYLMYSAYNNQKFVLPLIGPLAEKQA
jgi:uncharacterized membrane protein